MNHSFRAIALAAVFVAVGSAAQAQIDPPSRVGRLAFIDGSVSFHDQEQTGWSRAVVNTPLTSGDAIWTEPNARSEISLAGTRVRLEGSTQLDMLALDDSQTRLQVDRGRIDINTYALDPRTPYSIVTPRGTITLQQQGDYYVEAGSTQDATRLGVRAGAAEIQGLNGQTLRVRAGQVGEIYGDIGTPQLHTLNTTPPPPAPYWANRDRQINYDPPQYVNAGMTGYEDLNAYGSWSTDSQYGNVWSPRAVPAGWQPYRTGHWSNVKPWGWTWIDDQPWGYAPYHYGRWANSNNRWVWVPPQREAQPVYAPALVAFIGGIELAMSLGNQNNSPVGWFPLGPRETYVPSYTANRDYYNRINRSDQIQEQALESRWQAAQRREAFIAGQNSVLANQRFATVVPASIFVRSQPVAAATIQVSAAQLAAVPVAPVAAPPAPTASIATAASASTPAARPAGPNAPAARTAAPPPAPAAGANMPVAKTAIADMPTLGKPVAAPAPTAPGPKIATAPNTPAATVNATGSAAPSAQSKAAAPPLQPRVGSAPPALKDDKAPAAAPAKPSQPEAKAPAANDNKSPTAPTIATPAAPATPATPTTPQNRTQPPAVATPATPATPAAPATPQNRTQPPAVAAPATPATPAAPATPQNRTQPPAVATPATPATPAAPATPKPEATKPASPQAAPPPASPSVPQQATPARPEQQPAARNKDDKGADNRTAPPSQQAPVRQATPAPTPPPVATPAVPVTPAAPAQAAGPTPPPVATPKAAVVPMLTDEEKKAVEKKAVETKANEKK